MTLIMEEIIRQKLEQGLKPVALDVINESHLHAGHAGDNGTGESHFRVMIVSPLFDTMGRVERQRAVYALLEEELKQSVHALSITALGALEYDRVH
ncbi:MAG: BolA family protein [Micavibrio sp.]